MEGSGGGFIRRKREGKRWEQCAALPRDVL